jgi:hypothetical protein
MFYRHWKKVALALTAFFWVGCDDSTSVTPVSISDNSDSEQSSSSIENSTPSSSSKINSSSETGNAGEASQTSSSSAASSAASSSSEQVQSSGGAFDGRQAVPLYGVIGRLNESSSSTEPAKTPCYPDDVAIETNDATNANSSIRQNTLRCEDGVICVESEREISGSLPCDTEETEEGLLTICPDYGIVSISEKTYMCDGKVYNEAEFQSRYSKEIRKISCEVFGTEVECANGDSFIIEEKDGKKTYKSLFADLTEEEFNDKYEITEPLPAPLYGVFFKKDL